MARERAEVRPPSSASRRRSPQQARARRTVDALVEAAAEVFDQHGIDGATTERIVARAGVSVGSMYQYFPDKESLLAAVGERLCAEVDESLGVLVETLEGSPTVDEGVDALVDWLVAAHAGRRRLRCLLFEDRPPPEAHIDQLTTRTVGALEGWLRCRGLPAPEVKAVLLHRGVATLIHQFVLHPQEGLPADVAVAEVRGWAKAWLTQGV